MIEDYPCLNTDSEKIISLSLLDQLGGEHSANAPSVSLTVFRLWTSSNHGLQTVNETLGALADVNPRS